MGTETNLPGSSFEEIVKIIKGYANVGESTSLDDLANLIGMNKTVVSRNNKFLAEIEIISGGRKKTPTELGRKLGRALDHNQKEDAKRYWKESIQSNETFSNLVTTVRIKSGMSYEELSAHILYISGQKATGPNKTGANALVDILCSAGLLNNSDGAVSVAAPEEETSDTYEETDGLSTQQQPVIPDTSARVHNVSEKAKMVEHLPVAVTGMPSIAINIQLHLPETDNAEVYENLFRALREQLISPKEE